MDGELFEMERRSCGRSTRVVLRGELDLAAALELQDFLAELTPVRSIASSSTSAS